MTPGENSTSGNEWSKIESQNFHEDGDRGASIQSDRYSGEKGSSEKEQEYSGRSLDKGTTYEGGHGKGYKK
ncbi:MAG: hypothetical protein DWQ44_09690 [Bacteroidetes bacterium]|nr:MAG: hypothetical protein DWQ33_09965 [Bacteroidota bacterium]REK06555.1 MAG: hypothetical protein DWQ39_03480 [Bacteroidota bacterium]REK33321.1 MAG: hypothetical protein DWQ44_09690 [Bacteroidota bacterium]REK49721.1 MAG: hypothetical protein DWQ48_06245 [Bacteroidota bacterium]